MATHSSVLAWRIPGMGEPGGLPSMGSHRVGRDWSDLAVYICPWYFLNLSYPLLPPLCPPIHSLCLHLHLFSVNWFISTLFLDSIYISVSIQYLFFLFWLTSLCITGSRFIHLTTDSNPFLLWLSNIPLQAGVLQSMRLQRVGHDWVTEQQQYSIEYYHTFNYCNFMYTLVSPGEPAPHCSFNAFLLFSIFNVNFTINLTS